jgi:hypothetical protein
VELKNNKVNKLFLPFWTRRWQMLRDVSENKDTDNVKPVSYICNGYRVYCTKNATNKFLRFFGAPSPKDVRQTMVEILSESFRARCLSFPKQVYYFINGEWRFIVRYQKFQGVEHLVIIETHKVEIGVNRNRPRTRDLRAKQKRLWQKETDD